MDRATLRELMKSATGTAHRYLSIGRCIFCGDATNRRGREHIIPYALAGDSMIFDDATCKKCELLINKFEQPILATTLSNARIQVGAPSRTRKRLKLKSQTHISFSVADESEAKPGVPDVIRSTIHIPVDDAPLLYFAPRLRPPLLLGGDPSTPADSPDIWSAMSSSPSPYFKPGQRIYVGKITPLHFIRLLAKIAHAYAVATHGWNTFVPTLLPLIRGELEDFRSVAGGIDEMEPPIDQLYSIQWLHDRVGPTKYLTVRLRIWPFLGSPTYELVAGRFLFP